MASSHPRTGKWIVPAGYTWSPSSVVSVVLQTDRHGVDPVTNRQRERLIAIHVGESHRRNGLWTGILYRRFDDGEAFHDWLESYGSIHRRTYLFTHSVMDLLIMSGWWDRMERRGGVLVREGKTHDRQLTLPVGEAGLPESQAADIPHGSSSDPDIYSVQAMVHGVQIDIVRYTTRHRTFQLCSHSQYMNSTEEEIAKCIQHEWQSDPGVVGGESHVFRNPISRAYLWCKWYRLLSDWWLDIDGGPWGPTTAALAYSFLRRRLKWRTVLHHGDERAGELEQLAMHGGRRAVFFAGNVGTVDDWEPFAEVAPARSAGATIDAKMSHWDVKSMYPYLLSRMQFPIVRIDYKPRISVEYLASALQTHGVIAQVTLDTDAAEYPYKTDRGTIYPTGTFVTTLAGPELCLALASGHVKEVRRASIYTLGNPFKTAAEPLLRLRHHYKDTGELGWELLSKALANSMSGKLAPNAYHYTPRPTTVAPVQWGNWRRRDMSTGQVQEYRTWGGLTWERILSQFQIRPMGASYAYLISYGRMMSLSYRRMLPDRTVLAMDTDGLWCAGDSAEAFGFTGSDELGGAGDIRVQHVNRVGRFWSPQHYWYGSGWVLSGMSRPLIDPGTSTLHAQQPKTSLHTTRATPEHAAIQSSYRLDLESLIDTSLVDSDGWVIPPRL